MQWNLLKRGVLMGGLFAFSVAGFAQQPYPNRPVKIIVPFAASGPADNYARFMAQRLGDELKQSFVIDNKPGAASDIVCLNAGATLYVAGVAPDIAGGITQAKAAIASGAARQKLDAFVAATQSK